MVTCGRSLHDVSSIVPNSPASTDARIVEPGQRRHLDRRGGGPTDVIRMKRIVDLRLPA